MSLPRLAPPGVSAGENRPRWRLPASAIPTRPIDVVALPIEGASETAYVVHPPLQTSPVPVPTRCGGTGSPCAQEGQAPTLSCRVILDWGFCT